MGFTKYSMWFLLAVACIAGLWVFGRPVFAGITKWLLWALSALCVCTGLVILLGAAGKALPVLGTLALWVFAGYVVRVANSLKMER